MWKILVGFVLFAALAVFVLMKGGDVDMSGEKHGIDATHTEEPVKEEAASVAGSMLDAKASAVEAVAAQASAAEAAASAMAK
jgi:hypothetical protein